MGDFRRRTTTRLLRSLMSDSPPPFDALGGRCNEMDIGALCDQRNDTGDSEFCAFFDCPFHAVKFEDGKENRELDIAGVTNDFFSQIEFNAVVCD